MGGKFEQRRVRLVALYVRIYYNAAVTKGVGDQREDRESKGTKRKQAEMHINFALLFRISNQSREESLFGNKIEMTSLAPVQTKIHFR